MLSGLWRSQKDTGEDVSLQSQLGEPVLTQAKSALPYTQRRLHQWDSSCDFCVILSFDKPDTQVADHPDRKALVFFCADCRACVSAVSHQRRTHTGFSKPDLEGICALSIFSCRLDMFSDDETSKTSPDSLYRCCDYRSTEQDP